MKENPKALKSRSSSSQMLKTVKKKKKVCSYRSFLIHYINGFNSDSISYSYK